MIYFCIRTCVTNCSYLKKKFKIKRFMLSQFMIICSGGSRISPGGAPTYDFAKFSRKLHEIERIWVPTGGGCMPPVPPKSATDMIIQWTELGLVVRLVVSVRPLQ